MGSIVLAHDNLPDPFVREFHFPAWHRGFPWHPFDREADAAFLNAPEEIAFLEHGDRCRIGEVGRGRIESPSCRTFAVEVSAMAGGTIRRIESLPLLDCVWGLCNGIRQAGIFTWGSRMNRPVFPGRLIADRRAAIGLPADEQREQNKDAIAQYLHSADILSRQKPFHRSPKGIFGFFA